MHDRQFEEPEELSIAQLEEISQRLREHRAPTVYADGTRYYVFRPLAGLNGYYDCQVGDDES